MGSAAIPERVRRLILDAIDSVAELEALLLLRETPDQAWTIDAASARLYVSQTVAAYSLRALARRGFIEEAAQGFRYGPASTELAEDVAALAVAYSGNLIAVTQLIHGKPGPSVQDFARAFRLRKDS
ncbi:MAG TPA: hypothetical protein VHB46_17870 [Burkholderiales bacterium]|nr:hypothetical protein [Burkholderiales bacterium]